MKLLEAKTPDDALDQIKQAFTAAGKSADKMNRQELQLIASSVGMDEASVRQALSTKNAGISMQRAKSASAALEGQTMSTAQAMQVLSKDIEKMVKSAEPPKGENFFEVFFEGFAQGVERTAEFRGVLQNLMKSIWVVRQAGIELGEAFVKSFPGFRDVLGGLADILAPDKIGGLFKSFANTLKEFFASLKDGSMSVETLFKKLQKNVMDYFTAAGPGGQKFLNGLSDMWKAAKFIIVGALDYIGDMLKDGLTRMADYLDNGLDKGINSLAGGVMGEASPIIDAFTRLYEKVKDPILRIINKAFAYIGEKVGEFFKENWLKISAFLIGPALIMGVGQAFASASSMLLVETIVKPWLKKFVGAAGAASSADFEKLGGEISGLRKTLEAGGGMGPASDQAGKIDWKKVGQTFAELMVFVLAGLIALAGVLIIMKAFNVKQEDLLIIGVLVVSMAVLMLTAAGALKIVSSVDSEKISATSLAALAGIIIMMLLAAKDLVETAKIAKDVTAAGLAALTTIIIATGLMFLEAAVIVGVLSIVGKFVKDPTALGMGALAVIAVSLVMFLAAKGLVSLAKTAPDESKMKGVSAIMDSVSKMFLAASVVALAAMAVGAIILASWGIGGGAAAAGLVAIGAVSAAMVGTAMFISDQINGMKVEDPAAFKTKAEAVSTVMDSVTRMILGISDLLSSIPSGIATDAGRLKELSTMITGMLTGIENIIKQVVTAVQAIGASDSTLKAASSLANVMAAVAEVAKALQPGDLKEIYKAIDDDDFEKIPNIISAITSYAEKVTESLLGKGDPTSGGIIPAITTLVGLAAKWNEGDIPKIEALANLISAIAPLLKALTLPPELGPTLTEATKNWFGPNAVEIIAKTKEFIESMATPLKTLIDAIMDKFPVLISAVSMFNFNESQAKAVEAFMPVLKIAVETATDMAQSTLSWARRGFNKKMLDQLTAENGPFAQVATGLGKMMDMMAAKFPDLVASVSNAIKSITIDPAFVGKTKAVLDTFKSLGEIMGFFKNMKTAITEDKGSEFAGRLTQDEVDNYVNNILSMTVVIGRMLDALTGSNFSNVLGKLSNLSTMISTYKDIKTDKIKGIFDAIASVMTTLDTVKKLNIGELMKPSGVAGPDENFVELEQHGPLAEGYTSHLTNLGVMIGEMGELLDGLASNETGLAALQGPMDKVNKIFENKDYSTSFRNAAINLNTFNSTAGALKTAIEKLPDITPESVTGKTKPIKSTLDALVSEINSLNGVITADLEGKLALKGGKMELTVKKAPNVAQKPININVTFNATLDVGDVGKGLVKSENKIKTAIQNVAIFAGGDGTWNPAVESQPTPKSK
jgi:hypothetical protein